MSRVYNKIAMASELFWTINQKNDEKTQQPQRTPTNYYTKVFALIIDQRTFVHLTFAFDRYY